MYQAVNQIITINLSHQINLTHWLSVIQLLEWHVVSSVLTSNNYFTVTNANHLILRIWLDPNVGLTTHSFRSQCCASQIDLLMFFNLVIDVLVVFMRFDEFSQNNYIFLYLYTFAAYSIMVHAWLCISWWPDDVSCSIANISTFFENVELPSNKGIIDWVDICGNERSSPINSGTKFLHIRHTKLWEELDPFVWIDKLLNFFFRNAHILQNFILQLWRGFWSSFGLLSLKFTELQFFFWLSFLLNWLFFRLFYLWDHWWATVFLQLSLQLLGSAANWLTCYMEAKWE